MTETLRVNLEKTYTSLKIMSMVAGVLIACFVVYANVDDRMDRLEMDQAQFKGVMEERTRNMSERVDMIYDIVKEWSPDGQVD